MISEDEIIRRIRISDLGSANKAYADEMIRKYKIAAKTRLQYPTLTQKWTIDNQRQVVDVNDRTKIISGRGSPFFDKIEFMIKTESELEQFLGGIYPTSARQARSKKTFWERIDTSIKGNPKFSNYNKQIQEDEEKVLVKELKEEQRQNELKRKQFVSNPVIITPKDVEVSKPETITSSINPYYSLIPLGILGILLLYTRGGKS